MGRVEGGRAGIRAVLIILLFESRTKRPLVVVNVSGEVTAV